MFPTQVFPGIDGQRSQEWLAGWTFAVIEIESPAVNGESLLARMHARPVQRPDSDLLLPGALPLQNSTRWRDEHSGREPPGVKQWFSEELQGRWRQGLTIDQLLVDEQSPFQKIELYQTSDFGRMLVLDGKVQVCELDEFVYHEMLAHPAMLAHPDPRRVMVMGGGDGGTVREVLHHPSVQSVVLVEIDQRVIDLCRQHMPALNQGQAQDSRLQVVAEDASVYIKAAEPFDVILVDSSDPEGPSERLFSLQFYRQLKAGLAPGGVVALQAGSPFFFEDQLLRMRAELSEVFTHVRPYLMSIPTYPGGTWCMMSASDTVDPRTFPSDQLTRRFAERGLHHCKYYNPDLHYGSLALPNFLQGAGQHA